MANWSSFRKNSSTVFMFAVASILSVFVTSRVPLLAQEVEVSGDLPLVEFTDVDLDEVDSSLLRGETKSSIEKYTRILAKNANNARVLFNRGSARILSGDYIGALDDLQKAANLFEQRGKLKLRERALAQISLAKSKQKP